MDIKQAVSTAKTYVASVFQEEGITFPTLEEIEFDEMTASWKVTVGFQRPATTQSEMLSAAFAGLAIPDRYSQHKQYKIVSIRDDTGEPISIKNRDLS